MPADERLANGRARAAAGVPRIRSKMARTAGHARNITTLPRPLPVLAGAAAAWESQNYGFLTPALANKQAAASAAEGARAPGADSGAIASSRISIAFQPLSSLKTLPRTEPDGS